MDYRIREHALDAQAIVLNTSHNFYGGYMKKLTVLLLTLLISASLFAGGSTDTESTMAPGEKVAGEPWVNHIFATPADYEAATGGTIGSYAESPMLTDMVEAGELPPVADRLPKEPQVIRPYREIGKFGGQFRGNAGAGGGGERQESQTQGLLIWSPDTRDLYPNIIKGYELSADMKKITLLLREGMKWSDGVEIDANNFLFWYEDVLQNELLTPSINSRFKPGDEVMKMKVVNDYEVEYTFAAPFFAVLESWSRQRPFSAVHYMKQYHIKYNPKAQDDAKAEGYEEWWQAYLAFQRNGGGSYVTIPNGPSVYPWVLTEVSADSALFTRNPYYWKVDIAGNQLPYIDSDFVLRFDNPKDIVPAKAMAGEIDFSIYPFSLADFPVYKKNESTGNYTAMLFGRKDQSSALGITLNYTHKDPVLRKLFNDINFKKALSLAIDREDISNTIFLGLTKPFTAPVSDSWTGFEDWMGTYNAEFDLDQANKLLDELGLKWDANKQWRLRSDGKVLSFIIDWPIEWLGYAEDLMDLMVGYWAKIGISADHKFVPEGLFSERAQANEQDVTVWNTDGGSEFLGRSAFPIRLAPPWHWLSCCAMSAVPWRHWLDSKGAEGEEPPEDIKRQWELIWEWKAEPRGTQRYYDLANEIIKIGVEGMYLLGTVSSPPGVVIAHNRIGNVPDEIYNVNGMFYPLLQETFYIKE